jgi:hypothetical protein
MCDLDDNFINQVIFSQFEVVLLNASVNPVGKFLLAFQFRPKLPRIHRIHFVAYGVGYFYNQGW